MGRAWEGSHDTERDAAYDASHDDSSDEAASRFPLWIALGSCVIALAIYFTSTIPALREQRELRRIERAQAERLRTLEDARRIGLRTRIALDRDPQTVLLELDRLGLTPEDLPVPVGTPR